MTEYLYRYHGICYSAGVNEYGDPLPYRGRRDIGYSKFPIIKRTPCGAWIDLGLGEKKFVNLKATKQYACLTRKLALKSFLARQQRAITIMSNRIADCQDFIAIARKALEAGCLTCT